MERKQRDVVKDTGLEIIPIVALASSVDLGNSYQSPETLHT